MGNGQCDSPGFTAKNLCYFLMEMTIGYIIDLEVLDKREVELKSVNMDKKALENILQRIKTVLNVVEVVTDASASIKMMSELKNKIMLHHLLYIELSNSFLIGRKRTVKSVPVITADYTLIMSRTLKVTGYHLMYEGKDDFQG